MLGNNPEEELSIEERIKLLKEKGYLANIILDKNVSAYLNEQAEKLEKANNKEEKESLFQSFQYISEHLESFSEHLSFYKNPKKFNKDIQQNMNNPIINDKIYFLSHAAAHLAYIVLAMREAKVDEALLSKIVKSQLDAIDKTMSLKDKVQYGFYNIRNQLEGETSVEPRNLPVKFVDAIKNWVGNRIIVFSKEKQNINKPTEEIERYTKSFITIGKELLKRSSNKDKPNNSTHLQVSKINDGDIIKGKGQNNEDWQRRHKPGKNDHSPGF